MWSWSSGASRAPLKISLDSLGKPGDDDDQPPGSHWDGRSKMLSPAKRRGWEEDPKCTA